MGLYEFFQKVCKMEEVREQERLRREALEKEWEKEKIERQKNYEKSQEMLPELHQVKSGAEFEEWLVKLFNMMGYQTKNMQLTGDQGIDLIVVKNDIKYGIQAKYYSETVGNAAVQQVIAGREYYRLDKGVVITNSTYTPSAQKLALRTNIRLIDGRQLREITILARQGMSDKVKL